MHRASLPPHAAFEPEPRFQAAVLELLLEGLGRNEVRRDSAAEVMNAGGIYAPLRTFGYEGQFVVPKEFGNPLLVVGPQDFRGSEGVIVETVGVQKGVRISIGAGQPRVGIKVP